MKRISAEVIIVGGGLAGLTLAGVLGEAGVDVVSVDRDVPKTQQTEAFDGRTTAISFASRRVLIAAGVWDKIEKDCAPILDIRVADGTSPLFLHFSADEDGSGNPFGWIIENRLLRRALFENTQRLKKSVRHLAPAEVVSFFHDDSSAGVKLKDGREISAPLLIGADGRKSATRQYLGIDVKEWEYGQSAIVCTVAHRQDHENVAVEHFLNAGPFAILPMTKDEDGVHRSSVVWTVETKDAAEFLKLSPEDFDAELQKLFGTHLGKVRHVSRPAAYPLGLMHAEKYSGPRMVLMAEAAHVIHPIAGQGLNLSMRDVAVLSELIIERMKLGLDIGAESLLSEYAVARRQDTILMAGFTDMLNKLFSNNLVTVGLLRDLGLGIVDKIAPLKGFFARQAMGLGAISAKKGKKAPF